MLNVYLAPKKHSDDRPTLEAINLWLRELYRGGLTYEPTGQTQVTTSHSHQEPFTLELTPGLNASHLFNQDAHDALLPAELTFNSLLISTSKHPTLLPLDEIEYETMCPQCGDCLSIDDVQLAVTKLDLFPISSIRVFCISCQDEYPLKTLVFEPLVSFSRFWICINQSGSTRLNSKVLKGWAQTLNCELEQLNVQLEDLEHFNLGILESSPLEKFSVIDQAYERNQYRTERWSRKHKQTKKSRTKRRGRSI